MKKLLFLAAFALTFLFATSASAICTKIQNGGITDVNGNQITTGYDKYGYNYQAHMFNGLYDNFTRPATPVAEGAINLQMKWSDDWLSNQDCNSDSKLDRGLGTPGAATNESRGWLTNHIEGDCPTEDGGSVHATYFCKIIYVGPAGSSDQWADKRIWGVYALIEEVGEDPTNGVCSDQRGLNRGSLVNPAGMGFYTH